MSEDSEPKLIAFFDGACEPVNPGGTASYGVVVKSNGVTIFTDSAPGPPPLAR